MKNTNMCFPPLFCTRAFFGGGLPGVFQMDGSCFDSGSKWKSHVSSVVIILSRNATPSLSTRWTNSWEQRNLHSRSSFLSSLGTHLALTFDMLSSLRQSWTVDTETPSSEDISRTVRRRSSFNSCRTLSLTPLFTTDGRPHRLSSSIDSLPSKYKRSATFLRCTWCLDHFIGLRGRLFNPDTKLNYRPDFNVANWRHFFLELQNPCCARSVDIQTILMICA